MPSMAWISTKTSISHSMASGFLYCDRRMVILATVCDVSETKGSFIVVFLKYNGGLGFNSGDELVSGVNAATFETVTYDVRSRFWARVRAESCESLLHDLHRLQRRGG